MKISLPFLPLLCSVFFINPAGRSEEPFDYLPENSLNCLMLNPKALLRSPLSKEEPLSLVIESWLESKPIKAMREGGFDPESNFRSLTTAGSGQNYCIIIEGSFDAAEVVAKANSASLIQQFAFLKPGKFMCGTPDALASSKKRLGRKGSPMLDEGLARVDREKAFCLVAASDGILPPVVPQAKLLKWVALTLDVSNGLGLHIVGRCGSEKDAVALKEGLEVFVPEIKKRFPELPLTNLRVETASNDVIVTHQLTIEQVRTWILSDKVFFNNARRNRCEELLKIVSAGLNAYKSRHGSLPTTEQGIKVLWERPITGPIPENWVQLLGKEKTDPWKRPFRYRIPPLHSSESFDLWSAGPDGIDGTIDDLGNFPVR